MSLFLRVVRLAPPVRRCLSSVAAPSWPYDNRPLTVEEKARVSRKDADLRATYDAVKSEYPAHAQPTDGSQQVDKMEAYRKRLIYRSKQRGWCACLGVNRTVGELLPSLFCFTGWKWIC